MGSCLSKKTTTTLPPTALPVPPDQSKLSTEAAKNTTEEETLKKEILIINHRKSHDIDRHSEEEKDSVDHKVASTTTTTTSTISEEANICNGGISSDAVNGGLAASIMVRTSSCTKEEVDAILIQCGRLSRSSSSKKAALSGSGGSSDNTTNPHRGLKYSGSKRSYDFDNETVKGNGDEDNNVVDETAAERNNRRHRERQRQPRASSSPASHGRRRRTPSRERDQQQQQQRSGSRERGNSGGGRRVSRSPGRRTATNGVTDSTTSSANGSDNCRPGKMVSVPATVNGGGGGGGAEPPSAAANKRILVKRSAGDPGLSSRTAASPRSRSPARANFRASNENQDAQSNQHQQQPLSLSRSNSRKAEQSPYRRNPLSEIDSNIIGLEQLTLSSNNNIQPQAAMQKPNIENVSNKKVVVQGSDNKTSQKGATDKIVTVNFRGKEQQLIVEEAKGLQSMARDITVTAIASGDDSLKPQTLVRSRSSRRSRDLDLNPETLLNPNPSYTALLLEDIQNFHQKSTTTVSLPPCVTKACSILEAVADLNSSTSSHLSCTFSEDRRRRSPTSEQLNKNTDNFSLGANPVGKKRIDPFVESEVVVADDLIEPSLHKYVTMRGTAGVENMEEQESSGSNSYVGGQQHWVSSTSWELNSADSTDCWTSSRSSSREDDRIPLSFQRHALSEPGSCDIDESKRRLTGKKREANHQQIGGGRC